MRFKIVDKNGDKYTVEELPEEEAAKEIDKPLSDKADEELEEAENKPAEETADEASEPESEDEALAEEEPEKPSEEETKDEAAEKVELTADEIESLKLLAELAPQIIAMFRPEDKKESDEEPGEETAGEADESDAEGDDEEPEEEVISLDEKITEDSCDPIEDAACKDSKSSFGAIETNASAHSSNELELEQEIAEAWANRYKGGSK